LSGLLGPVPCAKSYGGYVSGKVVELNAGVHSLAIAIAVRFRLLPFHAFMKGIAFNLCTQTDMLL
jgi:hypothetical protein